jgi:hypothetical protein
LLMGHGQHHGLQCHASVGSHLPRSLSMQDDTNPIERKG